MSPNRLNALTDGLVAIVLTIMVLELKFPAEPTLHAVIAVMPLLAAYLLAFVNVAIYWNNHHHMMQSARKVTGAVLWANHALLFWLTLFPLMIRWIDEAGITALAGSIIRRCARWRIHRICSSNARSSVRRGGVAGQKRHRRRLQGMD